MIERLLLALLGGMGLWLAGCAMAPIPGAAPGSGAPQAFVPTLQLEDTAGGDEMLPEHELDEQTLYRLLLAEMAFNGQQYDLAAVTYLSLAREIRDPRLVRRAARAALLARDPKLLEEAASSWLGYDEDAIGAWQMMTLARLRKGDIEGAADALERADDWPGEVDVSQRYRWMMSLIPPGRQAVSTASEVFARYSRRHPENLGARFALAHLLSRLGQVDKALEIVDGILERRPGLHDVIVMKVRLLQMLGRRSDALAFLDERIERQPDDEALRLMQARLYMEDRRYEQALHAFESLSRERPDDGDIVYALAVLNLQLQRYDQAETYLSRLQAMGLHRDEVAFYQGWLAEKRGQADRAIRYYEAVGQGANYVEARIRLAILVARQGDLARARALLADLRQRLPGQAKRLLLVEAELLSDAEKADEAIALYAKGLETFPGDTDLLYARAMLEERLGQLEAFEADMRAILAVDPKNVSALNALGYTLADRTDRYDEAYRYIKQAYEQAPDNNAILDSMGWVLYKLGRVQEAIPFLRRSLELEMDNEVAAHLGEVLWVSGDREQARAVWQRALEAFPDDPVLHSTMERLGAR